METLQSVPELVAAAQAHVKPSEDRIEEIRILSLESDANAEDLRAATVVIELAAVDIFAVFEARMQHHFKRGPFSRKLKALLTGAGQPDLAHRIYQYYLAVNVLKHGTGASYRELSGTPNRLFVVKPVDDSEGATALIDVTVPGFFEGLTSTILEACRFLER